MAERAMTEYCSAADLPEPGDYCSFVLIPGAKVTAVIGGRPQLVEQCFDHPEGLSKALEERGITGAVQYDGVRVYHRGRVVAEVWA